MSLLRTISVVSVCAALLTPAQATGKDLGETTSFLKALEYDFRQGLWAAPQRIVQLYNEACKAGQRQACNYKIWHRGAHIANFETARKFFGSGCSLGLLVPCIVQGWVLTQKDQRPGSTNSYGITKSPKESTVLMKKACDGGSMRGCASLGYNYATGVGATQNMKKASALYKKACDRGNIWSCNNLAEHYEEGWGVKKSARKANRLYKKNCDKHNMHGCAHLGWNILTGNGIKIDLREGRRLLKMACDADFKWACYHM